MLHATITPIIVKMQTLEAQWETIALWPAEYVVFFDENWYPYHVAKVH